MKNRRLPRLWSVVATVSTTAAVIAATVGPVSAASAAPNTSDRNVLAGSAAQRIINSNSNKCLTIPNASRTEGVGAIQFTCNGNPSTGNPEQVWSLGYVSEGTYTLWNNNSGYCLAIPGASRTRGTQAVQWRCNGGREQQWRISSTNLRIINANSGLCLAIPNASTANSQSAVQWTCGGNPSSGNPEQDWLRFSAFTASTR